MTALVLAGVLGLAACTGGAASTPSSPAASGPALPATPASAAQQLSETGSSLMAPLFTLWGPAYHAQFPQVSISTASSSSGKGLSSAAAGTTDIGASDAYLSPADVTKYASLVNIPLAVAALMVIYHVPGVSPSTHLTPGAIGYVGVSYLSTVTKDNEGEVALGNSAGDYVLPTASTIQAGLASFTNTPANETISLINGSGAAVYPIINYEYVIVSISQASPTRAQDLRAFLNWAISTGTAQLAQVNFQPLPPSVVTLSQAQIATIKG